MTGAETRAEDKKRWRRGDLLAVLGAVALGAVLAVILTNIQGLRHDLQVANEARDALAAQVEGLGATPVAGEPGSRGEAGPSGPPGRPGRDAPPATPVPGQTGPEGDPGDAGKSGEPGADSTVPGPSGAAGQDGRDGQDSTVPGPVGPSGVSGQDGAPGQNGAPGEPGADGTDGADGQPPVSWTYTDPAGFSYTCSRVDGFDPSAPRYTCSFDGRPDPAQSAVGLFAVASLASYRRLPYGYRDSLS